MGFRGEVVAGKLLIGLFEHSNLLVQLCGLSEVPSVKLSSFVNLSAQGTQGCQII